MSDIASMTVETPPPARNFRIVALIIAVALFMEQLDGTVLVTALPTMAREFAVPAPSMSVAISAYLLSLAIFIPASGYVADRFGARQILRIGIGVFTLGSLLCSLAPNLPILVASRFLQGLGGAIMLPVSRLLLLRTVPRENFVQANTWLILPTLTGPLLGPPLGGLILNFFDWRWIFYINLPIGVIGIMLMKTFISDVAAERPGRFDKVGFLLSSPALACLFFAFETLSNNDTIVESLILLIVGLVLGGLYLVHARHHKTPILDLSLLRLPTFRLSVIGGALTRITQGSQPFLLAMMFQLGFGLSPFRSGLTVIATAIGAIGTQPFVPRLLRYFGFRKMLLAGGFLAVAGYASCAAFRPYWPYPLMFGMLVFSGSLMTLQFACYNTLAFEEIVTSRMGGAMSFYVTMQQLMLSVGVCTGALALHSAMRLHAHPTPHLWRFLSGLYRGNSYFPACRALEQAAFPRGRTDAGSGARGGQRLAADAGGDR